MEEVAGVTSSNVSDDDDDENPPAIQKLPAFVTNKGASTAAEKPPVNVVLLEDLGAYS